MISLNHVLPFGPLVLRFANGMLLQRPRSEQQVALRLTNQLSCCQKYTAGPCPPTRLTGTKASVSE